MSKRRNALLFASLLLVACGDKKEAAPEPAAEPAAAAEPETEKAPPSAHGNPHAANPHAAAAPAERDVGEPRDIKPSGETEKTSIAELTLPIPKEWEKAEAQSSMRLAEWTIPGPGGNAELAVFRFPGGAGGIEANVNRWKSQFKAPEGKSIDDVTQQKTLEIGDLKVTLVDIQGRFVASVQPGAAQKFDEADYRMLTAIVEGAGDPFFLKAVGPAKTMEVWAEPYETMLQGAAVEKG